MYTVKDSERKTANRLLRSAPYVHLLCKRFVQFNSVALVVTTKTNKKGKTKKKRKKCACSLYENVHVATDCSVFVVYELVRIHNSDHYNFGINLAWHVMQTTRAWRILSFAKLLCRASIKY